MTTKSWPAEYPKWLSYHGHKGKVPTLDLHRHLGSGSKLRCEWLQLIIVWEWGRPLRTISVRETRLSYRTTKDCQTCLHYKPSSFTLLGGVLKQYIWLELEMLVVQTYTAESGVCSTCFVTALYWNKDCCIRNKETSFISYNWRATHLAISQKKKRGIGKYSTILLFQEMCTFKTT